MRREFWISQETKMAIGYLTLILILDISEVAGYGSGPPLSTCFTQYPKHKGTATQTSDSPFLVTFNPTSYIPGQDVTIQVKDSTGTEFVGLQMAARRATDNIQEIVGRFVDFPENKTKAINCYAGVQNMLVHANKEPVTELTFKWRPPVENVGNVKFITTFVRSYKEFWHMTEADLAVDSNAPLIPSKYPAVPLSLRPMSIDFDACGDDKGCFYYPRYCSGSDCLVAATYMHRDTTNDFLIELYLNNDKDDNWVSIGFSSDEMMGNDASITCTGGVGLMSVQEGWNPAQYNERLLNTYSSDHEIMYKDGKITCRYVVPEIISVYKIDQANASSFQASTTTWNLMDDWYIMLAWGKAMPGSNVITYHADHPVVSSDKVDMTENVIIYSSTFHVLVQIHATLMIIAWILFAGIVVIISRHYRDWMENSKPCGSALWFQIHRGFALLVVASTLTGIIVIFAHYGTGIRDMATPHAYVGLAAVSLVGLQMICGVLRPGLDHSLRPVFNYGHRFSAHAAHILAALTMFLAYDIDYINRDMQRHGFITLSVWVGVQLFWHLMFEIIKRFRSKPGKGSDSYNIDGNELKPEDSVNKQDCPHTTTLITYVLTLMALCAAAIVPVYIY